MPSSNVAPCSSSRCRHVFVFFREAPKLQTPYLKKQRLIHGASVPDLRSDGESSSNDRTPPSASSSTRSSTDSSNVWTGSLPNLTVRLTSEQQSKDASKAKNDPYATYADNLHQIDEHDTASSLPTKVRSCAYHVRLDLTMSSNTVIILVLFKY